MFLSLAIRQGLGNDIPDTSGLYEILGEYPIDGIADDDPVTAEDVFSYLNSSGEITLDVHLGNAHLVLLYDRLDALFRHHGFEPTRFINAQDSHYYVDTYIVSSKADLPQYILTKLEEEE